MLLDGAVLAMNPHNGDLQWQVPFKADYSIAVSTPVFGPDNLLFVSSEYDAGTKVIELKRNGLQTTATELWSSNRLRLHHGNAVRIGDTFYFSNGGKGSQAILSAVDARSGKIHWQQRTIEKATFVWADQKLITLDQDGNLMIAHPSPQGFKISAKAPLLTRLSWTPPVLVGTRLYIRDRKTMMAVDLSCRNHASASGTTIPSADVLAHFAPESSVFSARLLAAFLSEFRDVISIPFSFCVLPCYV